MTRDFYRKFRSKDLLAQLEGASDTNIALLTILERIAPQYHHEENAAEFGASPVMSLPVHWHYSNLLRKAREAGLMGEKILSDDHAPLLQALGASEHRWLGNVPIAALVEVRRNGENADFRARLGVLTKELYDADEATLDTAINKVGRALTELLVEHDRKVETLIATYQTQYMPQAVGAWVTLCASWMPLFPSLAPPAALGFAAAYAGTKAAETLERRRLSRILTGVLAAFARKK